MFDCIFLSYEYWSDDLDFRIYIPLSLPGVGSWQLYLFTLFSMVNPFCGQKSHEHMTQRILFVSLGSCNGHHHNPLGAQYSHP